MQRVQTVLPAGTWQGAFHATATLDADQRQRRRIALTADDGTGFLLDLPATILLRSGDGLQLDDGRVIQVQAAPEALLEVRATDAHHMLRLAWHLGNRHLAAAIEGDRILIRPDHVIAAMLQRLGATVTEITGPFDPEGGAYGGAHEAHHSHADGPFAGVAVPVAGR